MEFLADHDLDILTNSFPIAAKLLATSRNRITLPGGTIFREQNIVLSPFDNDTIENFWGNKLFTGCYGLNRFGIMEADPLMVQAQTKLLKRTEDVIVMADSSKLRQKSRDDRHGAGADLHHHHRRRRETRRVGSVQGGGHQSDRGLGERGRRVAEARVS